MAKLFTEKDYNIIKKLLSSNLSRKEVISITGWKDTTVRNTEMADTWQDYCREKKERYTRNKTPKIKPELVDIPQSNDDKFVRAIVDLTQAINRLSDNLMQETLVQQTPLEKEGKLDRLFGRK